MKGRGVSHIALIIVNIIYGINYTVAKEVMPHYMQPFGFILLRVVAATLLFYTAHYFFVKQKIERKDIARLILCGVFGVALNQLMFFKGLNLTTPINASIMMISTPILVLVMSVVIIREKLSAIKITGVALGAIGAYLIISQGKTASFGTSTSLGDFLVFINATSYAIYLVLVKPLMAKYHPLTVVKWSFLFGSIMVIPFGYTEFARTNWAAIPLEIWLCIAYVVFLTTFLAYMLNLFAMKKVNPSVVGVYIYSQPVISTLVALSFQKDTLSLGKIIAALLIFAGVYLVSFHGRRVQLVKNT